KTMVFANTRETARHLAATLRRSGLKVVSYHAELSQADREKAVAMFRNGSVAVLASTDLAARGLDIEGGVDNIIHYDVPLTEQIFVHRNGRTARVGAHGRIFVLQGEGESLPDFMPDFDDWQWGSARTAAASAAMPDVTTLHLMAGKKEKISRGDVLGFLLAHNKNLTAADVGLIDVKDHYTLVAVPTAHAASILVNLRQQKLKGKRTRIDRAH
ncbi:MAG: DbpA RNA binding domain-containing protein, partial [Muribaculaceae bacterium]|nr:DbpA RNA binding domain-containing protein [Muribaculaceae bacterium]